MGPPHTNYWYTLFSATLKVHINGAEGKTGALLQTGQRVNVNQPNSLFRYIFLKYKNKNKKHTICAGKGELNR